jgi:hypothetical protein
MGDDLVLLTNGRNEWVNLNSDPKLQAFGYYVQFTHEMLATGANPHSTMPSFIIYYVGECIYVIL